MNYLKAALAGVAVLAFAGIVNAQQGGKVVISTPNAPEAIGPYSQAIQVGNTLYLAGQVAIDPKTKKMVKDASIEEQTKQVIENLKAVLEAAGMTMDNVVSSSVFMQDLNDFKAMNGVYATYFTKAPPARATVQVARLPLDAKIEISLIAVK